MGNKSKKQIESELLSVIQEILVKHNAKAAGKIAKLTKAAMKKIAKKFIKAAKSSEKKVAKKVSASKKNATKGAAKKSGRPLKIVKKAK